MKIALVDPSLFTWPYDRQLAAGLRAAGHEAVIFGKALPEDDPRSRDDMLRRHFYRALARSPWSRLPRPAARAFKGFNHAWSLFRLWRELRRRKPDVIHFQWLPLPIVDRRFLPLFRRLAPIVLTVHDTLPFNGSPASSLQTLGALQALKIFDRSIVHTARGRERLLEYVGDGERLARVPHGLLHDTPLTAAAPASVGAGRPTRFLLIGQLKPYKGVDVLVQALGRLTDELRAQCRVQVVGRPYMDVAPLVRMARELGLSDIVTFDFRFVPDEELEGMIRAADVLLFPYRAIEASGVLMTAISQERPVIASRLGTFDELIDDGRTGLLVPPGDPAALAQALERLIRNPAECARMRAEMTKLRASIPSWLEIARRTVAVYEEAGRSWGRGSAPTTGVLVRQGGEAPVLRR